MLNVASLVERDQTSIASNITAHFYKAHLQEDAKTGCKLQLGPTIDLDKGYPQDIGPAKPVPPEQVKNISVGNCDALFLQLHNDNDFDVNVTPLYVSSDFAVGCSCPHDGPLKIARHSDSSGVVPFVFRTKAAWTGLETLLLVYEEASQASEISEDLGWLGSPGLADIQEPLPSASRSLERSLTANDLRSLLAGALYQGPTLRREVPSNLAVGITSWRVRSIPQ